MHRYLSILSYCCGRARPFDESSLAGAEMFEAMLHVRIVNWSANH